MDDDAITTFRGRVKIFQHAFDIQLFALGIPITIGLDRSSSSPCSSSSSSSPSGGLKHVTMSISSGFRDEDVDGRRFNRRRIGVGVRFVVIVSVVVGVVVVVVIAAIIVVVVVVVRVVESS